MISIFPVAGIPILHTEKQLWDSLLNSLKDIEDGDVLVCAHTPFSRVMGYRYRIDDIEAGHKAKDIAEMTSKDPRKVELILRNSKKVVKVGRNVIITENLAGIVCANAGIDESNASQGYAVTIPNNPDKLAEQVRDKVIKHTGKNIAVIISDTVGRALRRGAVNIAIGCSGIFSMRSEVGRKDLFGYEMRISEIAIADEIASAAELIQGQTDEANPFVIVRGYDLDFSGKGDASYLNRPEDERLFK